MLKGKTDLKKAYRTDAERKGRVISVIILTYNNLEGIYRCIDSVLCQNYQSIEIIVSDDGTSNFSIKTIEQYIRNHADKNIVNIIVTTNESNLGTVRNLNKAISLSSGTYIKGIASDDKLYGANALGKYVSFLEKKPDCDIVFSNALIVYPDGTNSIHKNDQFASILKNSNACFSRLCVGNILVAGTACFRKSFFDKYGLFDERFFLLEDWPMWLKATRMGCRFGLLNETLFEYKANIGCSSASAKNKKYEEDIDKCYKLCIFPYIDEIEKKMQMSIFDKYFEKCVQTKGKLQEISFLAKRPDYLWKKTIRKLSAILK